MSSQGACEATKVWNCGRIPGSPSSEPKRIATSSPSGHSAPNRLEPQTEQKAFTRPPSGLKTWIKFSPASRKRRYALGLCILPFRSVLLAAGGRSGGDEVQGDARLVAYNPCIVARSGDEGLAFSDLHLGAVLRADGHAARDHIADVFF
jgi:hypothetical protein